MPGKVVYTLLSNPISTFVGMPHPQWLVVIKRLLRAKALDSFGPLWTGFAGDPTPLACDNIVFTIYNITLLIDYY